MAGNRKQEAPKFLTGWKEIASYLGKGVRTVQRYEREMGLPVRRPAGRPRAAVIATTAELDAWVAASPFRDALYLPRPAAQQGPFSASIGRSVEEMRRLRAQMQELRDEVKRTVHLLHDSIEIAQHQAQNFWSASNRDPGPRKNPTFNLAVTRMDGKAN